MFQWLYLKSQDQVAQLAFAGIGSYATTHDIFAASHRFIIKLRHYGIDQLYIRKVP